MTGTALVENALLVGAILFALGLVGILARRNLIVMFLSAELMLQGISVSLVAWSRRHGDFGGQVLVILVLTVAACEAAVALVFVLQAYARTGRLDAAAWQSLREQGRRRLRIADAAKRTDTLDREPPVCGLRRQDSQQVRHRAARLQKPQSLDRQRPAVAARRHQQRAQWSNGAWVAGPLQGVGKRPP